MKLQSLVLKNFRNYQSEKINFHGGINIIIGLNAQGKSNLLEGINYLSIFSSFRNAKDADMVRWGQTYFFVEGLLEKKNGEILLSFGYSMEKNKKVLKINGLPRKKVSDALGVFNSVVFSPEDLNIVKAGPSARRRYLDKEMIQLFPMYYFTLLQYQKILTQKNNLLREIKGNINKNELLEVWDTQLMDHGSKIINKRIEVLKKLTPLARLTHRKITNGEEELDLHYETLDLDEDDDYKKLTMEQIREIFSKKMEKKRKGEIFRGLSLFGPHRDDIKITVNGVDIRKFGSQGQQRTAALSLKIAELELVKSETGEYPVLLLDDVMSELDEKRRNHLLLMIGNKVQTFITTTDLDFKHGESKIIRVSQGEIDDR